MICPGFAAPDVGPIGSGILFAFMHSMHLPGFLFFAQILRLSQAFPNCSLCPLFLPLPGCAQNGTDRVSIPEKGKA
jgi:hypothetical protein